MVNRLAPVSARSKVLARKQLFRVVNDLKDSGNTVVFTNGCFDLLHPGHVAILEQARAFGDILVVGVNADHSVKRLNKGRQRPINSENDRALVIAALAAVDWVTVFREETPITLIKTLQPHVHVKGGDYQAENLPEYKAVTAYGGQIKIVPLVKGKSTTRILSKIERTHAFID